MKNLVTTVLFLSLFLISAMAGCISPQLLIGPAVTGVVYWINGEAHKYYEEDPSVLYRATKHALQELNLPITKDESQDNRYVIIAGEKDRFSITIEEAEKGLTKVSNRINVLGDKDYAELIYKKIDQQLDKIQYDPEGNPTRKHKFKLKKSSN